MLCASGLAITDIDLTANTALKWVSLFDENLTSVLGLPATASQGLVYREKTQYTTGRMISLTEEFGYSSTMNTWCQNYGTDWYMPSLDELREIYTNRSYINSTLRAFNFAEIRNNYYLSSTKNSNNYTYYTLDLCVSLSAQLVHL